MMLETKDREIERLANVNEMRQIGLLCSEEMLEADTRSFLQFFSKIKQETTKANQDLEEFKKTRTEATVLLRGLNDKCSAIQSQINKDCETLMVYQEYKAFLDSLRGEREQAEMRRIKAERKAKREADR